MEEWDGGALTVRHQIRWRNGDIPDSAQHEVHAIAV